MDKALTTLQPDHALRMALEGIKKDPKLSDLTKEKYSKTLLNYSATGRSLVNANDLRDYCLTVPRGTRSLLKAAIGRLAKELEFQAQANATPKNVRVMQAAIYNARALMNAIKAETPKGEKYHHWLTAEQLTRIMGMTRKNGSSLIEIRDRVALGLMSNGMLRRSEAAGVRFADIRTRDRFRILEVTGKGDKTRLIKLAAGLALDIEKLEELLGSGHVLRPILKRSTRPPGYTRFGDYFVGESISSQSLYNLVRRYGKMIGIPDLQPHDLRRTAAGLAYRGGVPIEQISLTLGHENMMTTINYLGIKRDWDLQPADVIPY